MKSTVAFLRAGNLRACIHLSRRVNARRPPSLPSLLHRPHKFQRQSRRQHHPAPAAVHPTPAPARSNAAPLPRSTRRAPPRIVTAASPHRDRRRAIVHPVPSSRCIVRYAVPWHLPPAPPCRPHHPPAPPRHRPPLHRTVRPCLHAIACPRTVRLPTVVTSSDPVPLVHLQPPPRLRQPHLTMPLSSSIQPGAAKGEVTVRSTT